MGKKSKKAKKANKLKKAGKGGKKLKIPAAELVSDQPLGRGLSADRLISLIRKPAAQ